MLLSFALLSVMAAGSTEAVASKAITDEAILGHVRFLSSDALGGRGPTTEGDRLTQAYIATQFESLGLKPVLANGQWTQTFDLTAVTGHPTQLTVKASDRSVVLQYPHEFVASSGHVEPVSTLVDADVIFVGYGIVAPEFQWDDFKAVDVRGKVVVVLNGDPDEDPTVFAGKERTWDGRWDAKFEQARKRGASGCFIVHTKAAAEYSWKVIETSWAREQFSLPAASPHSLQVKGWLTEDAAQRMVAASGQDFDVMRASAERRDFEPVSITSTISTSFQNQVRYKRTGNVLGMIVGRDSTRRKEAVIFSAHHDHLGMVLNAREGEDAVYNGAVDNASGVAALLALARAFTSLDSAPKRTVVFAAFAAEESGLLGSEHFLNHSPMPIDRMALNINIDGLNIWGRTRDVAIAGYGRSSVDAYVQRFARAQGRMAKPDASADRGLFFRSDQYNFARRNVPVAFFSSGQNFVGRPEGWGRAQHDAWVSSRYHQVTDEVTTEWDLSGAVEDVRLYFQVGFAVANASKMPRRTSGSDGALRRKKLVPAQGPPRR